MDNFCYKCGNKLITGANFCTRCGAKVNINVVKQNNSSSAFKDAKRDTIKESVLSETQKIKELNKKALVIVSKLMSDMVNCPAGSFIMGSRAICVDNSSELGRNVDEIRHKVCISKAFKIGKYQVTQVQYAAVMGKNPSYFKGIFRPVECVSWHDAKEFCRVMNEKYFKFLPYGYRFDLPTEAQWEYACRAGTTTSLNNGTNLTSELGVCRNLNEVAWYCKNSGGKTHFVGKKKPNAWGIYDMHGNVWEWCRDWYGKYEYGEEEIVDPKGPSSGNCRILRGGSWQFKAMGCRSAIRNRNDPNRKSNRIGFRLAVVPNY